MTPKNRTPDPKGEDAVSFVPPPGSNLALHDLCSEDASRCVTPDLFGLFYSGAVNSVAGEPGLGKTWLAVKCVVETLAWSGWVVVIDFEDTAMTWAGRLAALGVERAALARVVYLRAGGPLSEADVAWLVRLIESKPNCFVVVDSVAEALAAAGLDEDVAGDVTAWHQGLPRPLADAGGTVLVLDHVTKGATGRGRWARGSGAKLAAITGAAYGLDVEEPFSRERSGIAHLTVAKDRHGSVGAVNETAATVRFNVAGGSLHKVDIRRVTRVPESEAGSQMIRRPIDEAEF